MKSEFEAFVDAIRERLEKAGRRGEVAPAIIVGGLEAEALRAAGSLDGIDDVFGARADALQAMVNEVSQAFPWLQRVLVSLPLSRHTLVLEVVAGASSVTAMDVAGPRRSG